MIQCLGKSNSINYRSTRQKCSKDYDLKKIIKINSEKFTTLNGNWILYFIVSYFRSRKYLTNQPTVNLSAQFSNPGWIQE